MQLQRFRDFEPGYEWPSLWHLVKHYKSDDWIDFDMATTIPVNAERDKLAVNGSVWKCSHTEVTPRAASFCTEDLDACFVKTNIRCPCSVDHEKYVTMNNSNPFYTVDAECKPIQDNFVDEQIVQMVATNMSIAAVCLHDGFYERQP